MRRMLAAFAAIVMIPLMAGSVDAEPKESGPFRIAKIHYDQGSTLNSEYLVVKNVTGHKRSLTGWRIVDPNDGQRYRFPTTFVPAGSTVTLHTGHGRNRSGQRYWGQDAPVWNNDGDTAVLKKPSGVTADRCTYDGTGGGTATC